MANHGDIVTTQPKNDAAELTIATVGGLAFALILMFLCVVPLAHEITSGRDYVVFWATGQQLLHHGNPYDPAAMNQIERSAGLAAGYGILYMRNPPWALPLVLPLGLVGLRAGALIWSFLLLGCLLLSARLMRAMHGDPHNRIHWLALSFAPALLCFFMGQTALFALLGLVLFLRLYRKNPFAAGLALWLCALKPHLFLPFGAVLLVWVILARSYKILAGAATSLAVNCCVVWLLDPSAWRNYSGMMAAPEVEKQFIPCLSVAMRLWLSPHSTWLQYWPAALACAWALAYFWRHRSDWNWMSHGSLVMLVSLIAAPYCWMYDLAVSIPALLHGAYSTRYRSMLTVLAAANLPMMGAVMCGIKITSPFYLLIAPACLAWYVLADRRLTKSRLVAPSASTARDTEIARSSSVTTGGVPS